MVDNACGRPSTETETHVLEALLTFRIGVSVCSGHGGVNLGVISAKAVVVPLEAVREISLVSDYLNSMLQLVCLLHKATQ